MKKIILYIFVFVVSLHVGMALYEKPKNPGIYEEYIYKDSAGETPGQKEKAPMPEEGVININSATEYELTALPGIGSKMAERIVNFRENFGGFEVKEDLLRVEGIGEKTFEKIKDKVIVK